MKVKVTDKEVLSYRLDIEIEREGETYQASIYYEPHDGYEVVFFDSMGKRTAQPQWATDLEESGELFHSLGYWLEDQLSGRFSWTEREEVNAGI
jgi:hypothetical protein